MPLYDFYCSKCDENVELMLKIAESENVCCKVCGTKLEKTFPSKMNFQLIYNPKKDKVSWGAEGYSETQRYEGEPKTGK